MVNSDKARGQWFPLAEIGSRAEIHEPGAGQRSLSQPESTKMAFLAAANSIREAGG